MKKVLIGNKWVGEGQPTYIIAEAGSNHDGKLGQAKELIDLAAVAGVDAVKFQTFSADKLQAKTNSDVQNKGKTMYDILREIELPHEWLPELMEYANRKNLIFLSSTFDKETVDLLDEMGVSAFKIASGELTNFPLLRYTAEKRKPIIVSTGASTLDEIKEAITVIESAENKEVVLLHCISSYPTAMEDVNLRSMATLQRTFQLPTGYSDHTLGVIAPLTAVAMGAVMIEKHFTLDRNLCGPDHSYALEPQELKAMVENIRTVEKLLGSPIKQPSKAELKTRVLANRSIFASRDIPVGTSITEEMLVVLRPAIGLQPKYLEMVVGRKARKSITQNEPITWENV